MDSVCCSTSNPYEAEKEKQVRRHHMDVFMKPRSVAIIGASRKTGKGSFNVIENMKAFGFRGKIFPVNPLAKEIMGMKSYKDVREIDEGIDLAIISTPRDHVPGIAEDCADQGIKGAIVIPQGFADADAEGKTLQDKLTQIARQKDIRLLGPNTLGVVNAFSGFTSSFMPPRREKVPVGIICQSGIFFVGSSLFTGMMGKGIDVGNGCDLDFADALEYFDEDDKISVIFAHIEGMTRGRKFLEIAQKVSRKKPIIALLCFLGAIVLAVSGFQLSHSLFTGAAAMIILGVLNIEEAYKAIDWRTVFLLGGLIPLGIAMDKSGAARFLAAVADPAAVQLDEFRRRGAGGVLAGPQFRVRTRRQGDGDEQPQDHVSPHSAQRHDRHPDLSAVHLERVDPGPDVTRFSGFWAAGGFALPR